MADRHTGSRQKNQKQQKNRKRKREEEDEQPEETEPQTAEQLQQAMSERLERIRKTYVNKQRVLVLCSRGITFRFRHLMQDILDLLPHTKKDVKLDTKDKLWMINEICEMKNCNNCIFFEVRKKQDLFMWLVKAPNGPSIKFQVLNGSLPTSSDDIFLPIFDPKMVNKFLFSVACFHLAMVGRLRSIVSHVRTTFFKLTFSCLVHTMMELKFTGNCLKGSRPLLSFDPAFDTTPELQLMKEMFTQVRIVNLTLVY